MDANAQKITAKIDNDLQNHFFLSNYLHRDELNEIDHRIMAGKSMAVGFMSGEEVLFVAIFDFEHDCLHVRQVGGFFGRLYDVLDIFAQGLAKFMNKKYISFKSDRRAVAKWAAGNDYVFTSNENEFRKVLH